MATTCKKKNNSSSPSSPRNGRGGSLLWLFAYFVLTVIVNTATVPTNNGRSVAAAAASETAADEKERERKDAAERRRLQREWKPKRNDESQSGLFQPSRIVKVSGPSQFPKPIQMVSIPKNVTTTVADDETIEVVPILEPAFGRHRPDRDAVFAYAEGYNLGVYRMFLETLKGTGFYGDVVLAIAEKRIVADGVEDYLRSLALSERGEEDGDDAPELAVVVYQIPLYCEDRGDDDHRRRYLPKQGSTDVFQMCQLPNAYGWRKTKKAEDRQQLDDGGAVTPVEDPRSGRVVATIRYELYWIWSSRYRSNSWIMLIDARDSYFQSNPFANLPRDDDYLQKESGTLYFFGENADATRLGSSQKNMKWIRNGYGEAVIASLKSKPTICSGSTMGEQVAVEAYLRALVNEHDEGSTKMTGSDQGFHNYLYYSGKLQNAEAIGKIVVWEQGRGIINNLGALRTKPLKDWGIYDEATHAVYQWDGQTLSPVVHQWDRDGHLHTWMFKKRQKEWEEEWVEKMKLQ